MADTPQHSETHPAPPSKRGFFIDARALIKKNPILSAASGLAMFILGWAGTIALDTFKNYMLPDPYQARAEALRDEIKGRAASIESKLATLKTADGEEFQATAAAILSEIEALKPDIAQFATQADRMTARLINAKSTELASTGQSGQADFILPSGGGVTLCPERFTMGFNNVSYNNSVDVRLSRNGKSEEGRITPGQTVRMDSDETALAVSYLGQIPDADAHRFNFTCLRL